MIHRFRKILGGNMIEYVIPVAIVGIAVGMGVYSLSANGTLQNFFAASAGAKIGADGMLVIGGQASATNSPTNSPANSPATPPSNSPATPTTPTFSCDAGTQLCTLSDGVITLTNIPQNSASYITTAGGDVYTDNIAAAMAQVAAAVKQDALDTGDSNAMKLAGLFDKLSKVSQKDVNTGLYVYEEVIGSGEFNVLTLSECQAIGDTNKCNPATMISGASKKEKELEELANLYNPSDMQTLADIINYGSTYTDSNVTNGTVDTELVIGQLQGQINALIGLNPSLGKYSTYQQVMNSLSNEVGKIDKSFYNAINDGKYDEPSIKSYVASTSTDIRAQLMAALNP